MINGCKKNCFTKFREAAFQDNTPKGVFFIAEVGITLALFVLSLFLERR